MASHMSVQKIAAKRNSLAEMLIDFILQKFSVEFCDEGFTTEALPPEQQKSFSRNDCSEVYDHYLELPLSDKLDAQNRTLKIWAQTTCYKGNATGKPESNKTYEIRETLVEALTLRKWLTQEKDFFRTIHFTLGPSNYTYGWFMYAKKNAFDLSLYPEFPSGQDIFDVITDLGKNMIYQFDFYEKLDALLETPAHPLSQFITNTITTLKQYFIDGFAASEMADKQAALLTSVQNSTSCFTEKFVQASKGSGMNIKGKSVQFLEGKDIGDPVLSRTLKRLLQKNPFLPVALDALNDWSSWSSKAFHRVSLSGSLSDYVKELWSDVSEKKYIIHRLLMRIYTDESINYIQDLNISGLDEHNLYNGDHTPAQISELCTYLIKKYRENGITTAAELYKLLISSKAKNLINSSLKFERINGTSLKPSFFYLEEYISPKYELVSFEEANLPVPIAFYAKFSKGLNVRAYDNLKVIRDSNSKKNLAIVKGKFFRQPEFPRRVKEESYVGITAKYDIVNDSFTEKYPGLPFLMFIDMMDNYTPPSFAIRRLVNFGWEPYFQLSNLYSFLESIND